VLTEAECCWTIKTNKQDTRYIVRGRYCKNYKIPPTTLILSYCKTAKPRNAQTIRKSCNGRNKEKRKTRQKKNEKRMLKIKI
jgi:hypothetical protein